METERDSSNNRCGRRLRLIALAVVIAAAGSLSVQTGAPQEGVAARREHALATLPQFEVASIKPSGPKQNEMNGFYTYPGGRVACNGCWVQYLIMVAFDVQRWQISGGPAWSTFGGARYDLQAKPPESSESSKSNPAIPKNPPNGEQRRMLQSLMMDRFQLKFHRETKDGVVYKLVRGSSALTLRAAKDKHEFPWAGGIGGGVPRASGLSGLNISMPELASRISGWLARPVLDETGLPGSYDFEYQTGTDDDDPNADIASSIITSLKGLGLNLKTGKGPVESIVIDRVERPSEN